MILHAPLQRCEITLPERVRVGPRPCFKSLSDLSIQHHSTSTSQAVGPEVFKLDGESWRPSLLQIESP